MPPSWRSLAKKYVQRHMKTVSDMRNKIVSLVAIGPVSALLSIPVSGVVSSQPSIIFLGLFTLFSVLVNSASKNGNNSITDVLVYEIPWVVCSIFSSLILGGFVLSSLGRSAGVSSLSYSTFVFILYVLVAMSVYGIVLSILGMGIRDSIGKIKNHYKSNDSKTEEDNTSYEKEPQKMKES